MSELRFKPTDRVIIPRCPDERCPATDVPAIIDRFGKKEGERDYFITTDRHDDGSNPPRWHIIGNAMYDDDELKPE